MAAVDPLTAGAGLLATAKPNGIQPKVETRHDAINKSSSRPANL